MHWRRALLLIGGASLASGCVQPLETGASSGIKNAPGRDPNAGPTTTIEDPEIALDPGDESATTTEPCVKTTRDAHRILGTYCGSCHDRGAASSGVPKFDFLMDDPRLMSASWTVGAEERKFVVAGDPSRSWLYMRPLLGTMPPIQTDLRNSDYPRPTISDISVLGEWISHCIDPSATTPPPAPTPVPTPTPTSASPDPAEFNFESGTQGWIGVSSEGPEPGQVSTSTTEAFAGGGSLAGLISATAPSSYSLETDTPPAIPAGAVITYHAMIPADAPITGVQPYLVDAGGTVTGSYLITPATGSWLTLTVVRGETSAVTRLGVTFFTRGAWRGKVFVDSVEW